MRCSLVFLVLLGCASRAGSDPEPAPTSSTTPGERVLLVDERGTVYRTTTTRVDAEEQVVPGTMRQSVEALVGAYESFGLSVNTVDWTAGQVAARGVVAPRRIAGAGIGTYVDCGSSQVGQRRTDSYAVTLDVESVVRPEGSGRMVISTLTNATARARGVSGAPVPCTTTHALERRIHLQVAQQLAGK